MDNPKVYCFVAIFLLTLLPNQKALTKVEPPNYDFSLDAFQLFSRTGSKAAIEKKYGKGEVIASNKDLETKKYYVSHIRYKFPVYVQMFKGIPVDFYARLPNYFLHNVFHQSIINRFGKQDIYKKQEEQAVYIWKSEKKMRYIYSGACTITCFPIYFVGISQTPPEDAKGYIPVFQSMQNAASFK